MAKKKKEKIYVVVTGVTPGIYFEWNGENGAEQQIAGYPKSVYKSFKTIEEAQTWLEELNDVSDKLKADLQKLSESSPQLSLNTQRNETVGRKISPGPSKKSENNGDEYKIFLKEGKVVLFTDGAASGNPGPGGYGVVLLYKRSRKELSGGFRLTTNNRMELLACIVGLETLKFPCSVVIYSDSKYVVDAVEKGWARKWQRLGWMRDKENKAKNPDLWKRLLDLLHIHDVRFQWVRGHSGTTENERCDILAVRESNRAKLPADSFYEQYRDNPPVGNQLKIALEAL